MGRRTLSVGAAGPGSSASGVVVVVVVVVDEGVVVDVVDVVEVVDGSVDGGAVSGGGSVCATAAGIDTATLRATATTNT